MPWISVEAPENVVEKFHEFCTAYELEPPRAMSEALLEYVFHHDRDKLFRNRKRMLRQKGKSCRTTATK